MGPNDQKVLELNEIAAGVMAQRSITVVDLYDTMTKCGNVTCGGCKPHCGTAGYGCVALCSLFPGHARSLSLTFRSSFAHVLVFFADFLSRLVDSYNYLVYNAIVPAIKKALAL